MKITIVARVALMCLVGIYSESPFHGSTFEGEG